MSEAAILKLEECYRKNLGDLGDFCTAEMKIIQDKFGECDNKLRDIFKVASNELEKLRKELEDMKNGKSEFLNESQLLQNVQTENLNLQQKLKEIINDRQNLFDKFKNSDQLKHVHELELLKIRSDTLFNKKILQETVEAF